jgi:hypothetical protein
MEVHIKRRHRSMGLALSNPYGTINARSFGYPNYNLKPNYSPSNTVFNDGASVWGLTNRSGGEYDHMNYIINHLSKQVRFKDLIRQLMPSYYPEPYLQQFYHPSTLGRFIQKSPNFSTLPLHQSWQAIPAGSINIPSPISRNDNENLSEVELKSSKLKSFHLISLRGLICDKCLMVDTILICLNEDGTVKEIHNHSCSEDRLVDLKRRDKQDLIKFFVVLHRFLPRIRTCITSNIYLASKLACQSAMRFYVSKSNIYYIT